MIRMLYNTYLILSGKKDENLAMLMLGGLVKKSGYSEE